MLRFQDIGPLELSFSPRYVTMVWMNCPASLALILCIVLKILHQTFGLNLTYSWLSNSLFQLRACYWATLMKRIVLLKIASSFPKTYNAKQRLIWAKCYLSNRWVHCSQTMWASLLCATKESTSTPRCCWWILCNKYFSWPEIVKYKMCTGMYKTLIVHHTT